MRSGTHLISTNGELGDIYGFSTVSHSCAKLEGNIGTLIILEVCMITFHAAVFPNEITEVNFLGVALIRVLIRTMYQVILFIKGLLLC